MNRFCRQCGKEEILEWTGEYEITSGEKEYRMVCPDFPCEHSGHVWKSVDFPMSIIRGSDKCTRCGRYATLD